MNLNKFSPEYEIPDEKLSYSELKDRIRKEVAGALPKKERIMLLAKKLEYDLTIKDTICSQICTDFKDLISPDYIKKCLPEEYKQKSKMRRGTCNTNIANDDRNVAEQRTVAIEASTGQGIISEPESDPKEEIIKLRKQLEEKDKEIATLQASQNIQDPQLVDDKIGPIKVLSRVSENDRRSLQASARRFGEEIRRKLTSEGKATVKFYRLAEHRTKNIERLVPVVFTVDMMCRTTEVALDESKLWTGLDE
jgi:hypothetical protein